MTLTRPAIIRGTQQAIITCRRAMRCRWGGDHLASAHGIMNNAVAGHLMHAHYLPTVGTQCNCPKRRTEVGHVRIGRYSPRATWREFERYVCLFVCLLACSTCVLSTLQVLASSLK